jgi:TRAP-type C4-dicarboxylate transport system permease small subunit
LQLTGGGSGPPRSALDALVNLLALLAGAMLCALVVLICIDVASRSLRLFATPWTLDIAEYLLYGITFFGAPWVLREEGHIAIEIVVERLAPRPRRLLRRCTDGLGALVCAVLCYYALRMFWRSYSAKNLVQQTFVFPEWYLYVIAPPIFLILLLLFLRRMLRSGTAAAKGAGQEF